jgi:diadenosine tetraphosphatase ApaH/serine/threonine PP2A family protein phosphatase
VRGNHERYLIGATEESLKDDTLLMTEWTKTQMAKEHFEFVEKMPNKMQHELGFLVVHGSPRNKDEYLLRLQSFVDNLKLMEEKFAAIKICFHGHTHLPSIMAKGHIVQNIQQDQKVELDSHKLYLINPGSVGQPRDHCPLTSFGILDTESYCFYFYRRAYDVETAQKKILELGLAPRFAERLSNGK